MFEVNSVTPIKFQFGFILNTPLQAFINIPAWDGYQSLYWDHQLVSFLACGFLDVTQPENWSNGLITNHISVGSYASHTDHYIDTEN